MKPTAGAKSVGSTEQESCSKLKFKKHDVIITSCNNHNLPILNQINTAGDFAQHCDNIIPNISNYFNKISTLRQF
jgi:hypothetical protein